MMKKRFLERINAILASVIAFLGVGQSAYSQHFSKEVMCKYGVPHAEHIVTGKVTSSNGKPLKDMEVEIQISQLNIDRVVTDENGNFEIRQLGFPGEEATIVVSDPQGKFEADTVKLPIEYTSQDAWNRGTVTLNTSIKMRRKDIQIEPIVREKNPIICLYGVPNAEYVRLSDDEQINDDQQNSKQKKEQKKSKAKRSKRVKK